MRKALKKNIADVSRIDEFDVKLLSLLTSEGAYSSKELATKLDRPLSTVQRRIRILFESGYIRKRYEVDYLKLGWRKGVLNVYLKDGDPESVAKKVLQISGVIQVSVPLGDSDLSASVVYKTNEDALHLIRQIKRLPEVQSVTWTEEVLSMYATHPVITDSLSDAI